MIFLFLKDFYYKEISLTNFFLNVIVYSAEECFKKCENDNDCFAVTFDNLHNACYFYRNGDYGIELNRISVSTRSKSFIL